MYGPQVSLVIARERFGRLQERISASGPAGLVWGACALAAALVLFAVADPRGVRRVLALRAQSAQQQKQNQKLSAQNEALQQMVRALGPPVDLKVLEREAREQLGWVKPGELLFKFE